MPGIRTRDRRHEARKRPIQERARATVDAILTAAAQVFDAEGYVATTTDRVAARAGVSVGSLYQYYPSKDALLVGLFERHLDEVEAAFASLAQDMAQDVAVTPLAERLVHTLFALHRGAPGVHRILLEDAPIPAHLLARYAALELQLRTAWQAWLAPRVAHPGRVAVLGMALLESLTHRLTLFPVPGGHAEAELDAEAARMLAAYLHDAVRRHGVDGGRGPTRA
ncbi:MAG: TetR/AcrR family transcriptional regulator [Alphaproteobacteria bacterium]|nr:TetR/AcrR family transcriptional regulator [Alphaproteobacteria bacterium]